MRCSGGLNPLVHAELSWLTTWRVPERRDRWLIVAAGLAPDLDGLTLLAGEEAYGRWHHVLTHGFAAALAVTLACALLARSKAQVAGLSLLAFHLHLLCDLAGSGPGWPICYLWPLSLAEWSWSGQWNLASWQNTFVGLVATLAALACALPLRRTPVELFSVRADAHVVRALRGRFIRGATAPSSHGSGPRAAD